jgi:hypothetical protein
MKRAGKKPAAKPANRPAAKPSGVLPGERCAFPVQDEEKRGTLCLKPAVAERDVPTGFGDETVSLTFCAERNAAIDAHGGDAKAAAETAAKRGTR